MTGTRPYRLVAFGDLLMRLNPPGFERLVQASTFEVRYTGAEANVAAMLVSLGVDASVVSRVPEGEVGQACLNYLRRFGIDTRFVARGGPRLGLFFLELGAAQRASQVIYDRSSTSFTQIELSDVDWQAILDGADWLHFSGTSVALGAGPVGVLREGLVAAGVRGVKVSCDLNYRSRLWSLAQARDVMTSLMPHVDVLIGDVVTAFGVEEATEGVTPDAPEAQAYRETASDLTQRFGLTHVATTVRESRSASANRWSGLLFHGSDIYRSRIYEIEPVVDRVGGGDAFSAGLILGLLQGWDPQQCVEFAAAASCLKHSIVGDFNLVSREEIDSLVAGDASGRIRR